VECRALTERDFNDGFEVDADPGFLDHGADGDFDLAQGRLDRGGAITVGDGGGSASDKAAAFDDHALAGAGAAVGAGDDDGQAALEKHVVFEGGPVTHRTLLALDAHSTCSASPVQKMLRRAGGVKKNPAAC
jgi:hypothetical protein